MDRRGEVLDLDDPAAADVTRSGAKAANLAAARQAGLPALPGAVLTTSWRRDHLRQALDAWRSVSSGGVSPVVVRSSSTGEDGAASSMAGVFDSVLDVLGEDAFVDAVVTVLDSASGARDAGLVDAPMAVLVQPMLRPAWGGVLFGADPVTARRDRLVVAAVAGGPAALVAGEVDGWTAVLDLRGRVREMRSSSASDASRPPASLLRRLARLAADAERVYGGPQDIEWAVDEGGEVVLLQARPITTLPSTDGIVYGSGPVAESFPEPLAPLEQELWLDPLRDGLREALRLAGTASERSLARTPLVVAVDGMAAVDLTILNADDAAGGWLRRFDPRPPARQLRAAWRVGRLRSALPELAADVVRRVDAELLAVPDLAELSNHDLLSVLRNGRRLLASLHGHEALVGLLIPDAGAATVTGASLALSTLAQARAEGVELGDVVERDPVVLALVPPRVGPEPSFDALDSLGPATRMEPAAVASEPDPAAISREALRLRIRWVQELAARAAWTLGRRLVGVGVLPTQASVRLLGLDELAHAVQRRTVPDDLGERREPSGAVLPARFRVADDGSAVAAPAAGRGRRRRGGAAGTGVGAGGGVGSGPVHVAGGDDVPVGVVLVVSHLDPRLAPAIPRLAGLVAETGNPLSHLAILAREHHVPTVVGLAGATARFAPGEVVTVDGHAGTVEPAGAAPPLVHSGGIS